MQYDRSAHCVHCHRFHIVRATKCRHGVLVGDPRLRVRTVRRRVRRGNGVSIPHGALPGDRARMSVSVPPKPAVPDLVRRMMAVRPTGSSAGSPKSAGGAGDAGSGAVDTSRRPSAPSRTDPCFSILAGTSLTLPAPAGSYSPKAAAGQACRSVPPGPRRTAGPRLLRGRSRRLRRGRGLSIYLIHNVFPEGA